MFDACITEPHIRRYYAWLMQYGEDPEEKGDFNIVARGSTALVERDIQSQEMIAVLQLCLNPSYGKDPERAMDEYLKSRRFDPAAFDYSDEKKAKMAAQPQMPPPPVMIAQMREQGATERKQMDLKAAESELLANAQIEKARQDFEAKEAEKDRQLTAMQMEVDAQLKREDLSSTERVALEREKVLLANVALRLKVQERMANNSRMSAQVMTPAVEPAGRAAPGQAFVQ
jgi:hypothetical protein